MDPSLVKTDYMTKTNDIAKPNNSQNMLMSFLKRLSFPYTLGNLLIATSLFFIYTAVAFSKNAFAAYSVFLIAFVLYMLILIILLMRNVLLVHTMILSFILFMGFYNFIPMFFVKNISPNNYLMLLTSFFLVASIFIYNYGYIQLIQLSQQGDTSLPDYSVLHTMSNTRTELITNVGMTFFLSLIGAVVADTIVLFCFGSSYLPNYIINSNVDVCYRPTKQSFKCNMYKDGKLVS